MAEDAPTRVTRSGKAGKVEKYKKPAPKKKAPKKAAAPKAAAEAKAD
jgi:hypothetical protein